MIRTVIHINEELCSGCGLCASVCKEGAIAMVNGKARLIRRSEEHTSELQSHA